MSSDPSLEVIKKAVAEMRENRQLLPIIAALGSGNKSKKELRNALKYNYGLGSQLIKLMKLGLVGKIGNCYALLSVTPTLAAQAALAVRDEAQDKVAVPIQFPVTAPRPVQSASPAVPPLSQKVANQFKVPASLPGLGNASIGQVARCVCGTAAPLRYGSTTVCYVCARKRVS